MIGLLCGEETYDNMLSSIYRIPERNDGLTRTESIYQYRQWRRNQLKSGTAQQRAPPLPSPPLSLPLPLLSPPLPLPLPLPLEVGPLKSS